jgi:hypothetical protein
VSLDAYAAMTYAGESFPLWEQEVARSNRVAPIFFDQKHLRVIGGRFRIVKNRDKNLANAGILPLKSSVKESGAKHTANTATNLPSIPNASKGSIA